MKTDNPQVTIRLATLADIPRLEEIYRSARRYMRSKGNLSQWSESYPSAESAMADIERGWCHIVESGGRTVATFCLMTTPEPTYSELEDALTVPYVTLHRVASDGSVSGVLSAAVKYAMRHHCDIRIDTHADNAPMRQAIEREEFMTAGAITLADGSPRTAYRLQIAEN